MMDYTQEDYEVLRSICRDSNIRLIFHDVILEMPLYSDFLEYILRYLRSDKSSPWGDVWKLIYEVPIEDIPLSLNDSKTKYNGLYKHVWANHIAVWRLRIGK